jgi:hypothetical protein
MLSRDIFAGLRGLHMHGFGHGDLRWANIIKVPSDDSSQADHYILIDLEQSVLLNIVLDSTAVEAGDAPTALAAVCYEPGVLLNHVYTPESDLVLVARMMESSWVHLTKEAISFAGKLAQRQLGCEDAIMMINCW